MAPKKGNFEFDYTAFYCEENIQRLDQGPNLAQETRHVVFISNPARTCPLWAQRAAADPEGPIFWDYHVVLVTGGDEPHVWDLDSRLRPPTSAERWLKATFPLAGALQPSLAPRFRVVDSETFQATFSSDRSHMQGQENPPPPPPWPAPFAPDRGMNLPRFIDMTDAFVGTLMDFVAFRRFLTAPPRSA